MIEEIKAWRVGGDVFDELEKAQRYALARLIDGVIVDEIPQILITHAKEVIETLSKKSQPKL